MKTKTENNNKYTKTAGCQHNVPISLHLKDIKGS
jgi:hypothetical protein